MVAGAGLVTFIGGFATIAYNAINYGKIAQREKETSTPKGLGDGGYWQPIRSGANKTPRGSDTNRLGITSSKGFSKWETPISKFTV